MSDADIAARTQHVNHDTVVGWREYVDLPDFNVRGVLAKIDTGARTSALHVDNIVELPGDRVRFDVVLSRKDPAQTVTTEADLVRTSKVKPSSGQKQHRLVVATTMRLGDVIKTIEVSLVSRHHMLCRMLVGRTALENDFLVDPARKYVFGRKKYKRKKTLKRKPKP